MSYTLDNLTFKIKIVANKKTISDIKKSLNELEDLVVYQKKSNHRLEYVIMVGDLWWGYPEELHRAYPNARISGKVTDSDSPVDNHTFLFRKGQKPVLKFPNR